VAIDTRPPGPVTEGDDAPGRGTMPLARPRVAPGRVGPRPGAGVRKILPGKNRTLGDKPMWERQPESVADVWRYTRAGGWVPGDHSWKVELPGKVYGYCFAVPVTAVAHLLLWTVQRPARLIGVALLAGLLWWASGIGGHPSAAPCSVPSATAALPSPHGAPVPPVPSQGCDR
jgi:hypothetical protein